jgi:hypothetical protein
MDTGDSRLYVWIARVDTDGETAATVWSARDKARKWCEHVIDAGVTWDEDDESGDRVAGHANGDIAATVQRAEVKDPVSLAELYPRELPNGRDILADE